MAFGRIYPSEASRIRDTKTLLVMSFLLCTLACSCIAGITLVRAERPNQPLSFSGTQTFVQRVEIGSERVSGQSFQIRGRIDVYEVEETGSLFVDGLLIRSYSANGVIGKNTQLRGKFLLDTDDGDWEGRWTGTIYPDGREVNTYMGHGTGALDGYIIRFIFDSGQTLSIYGAILMPRGS